jgi:hypothetical protein
MGQQFRQLQQIGYAEAGAACRKLYVFVRRAQVRPRSRHTNHPAVVSLQDQQVAVPASAVLKNQKCLAKQRMKGMGDSNAGMRRIGRSLRR